MATTATMAKMISEAPTNGIQGWMANSVPAIAAAPAVAAVCADAAAP
jgi:hypothetical protein